MRKREEEGVREGGSEGVSEGAEGDDGSKGGRDG